jgi:hypothetical protein
MVTDMADASSLGSFQCPGCGKTYSLKPPLAGKTVQCKCGQKMIAPPLPVAARAAAPPPPTAAPSKPATRRKVQKPNLAELIEEEGDESFDEPAAPKSSYRPSRRAARPKPAASGDGDGWKWWYYIVAGVLIAGFSVWQLIDGEPIIRFGGRRGGPIGGFFIAALCIAVGLFSRPGRDGSDD